MKRFIKSLVLVTLLLGMVMPSFGQSSTEGKEFWVSLIPSKSPDGTSPTTNGFGSYIAISAPKACTVKVSNPNTGWSQIYTISTNNAWYEIKDIPLDEWYSTSMPASETVLNKGLKVEATENVSVFCCLRWNNSMDATNILPVTALQSEYIVQTYVADSKAKDFNALNKTVFTILAAEDCIVDVTLTAETDNGKVKEIKGIELKAGQVYHVISADDQSLQGCKVVARNDKKIAVFAGCPLTRVPNYYSDRELLYEQLFPVDYWGMNFVVVRSKEKDVNRVIVTAKEDNTTVTIYGHYDPSALKSGDHVIKQNYTRQLEAGESFEFEMSAGYADNRWDNRRENFAGITFMDTAVFISTSCPCAVVSFDVGNYYFRKDNGKETVSFNKPGKSDPQHYGAPAMTWIAPIEQMMDSIVFGVMGTDKTQRHFVNIIVETKDTARTKMNGKSLTSYFYPVEGNNKYSYARITLPHTSTSGNDNMFYKITSPHGGFTATVYGNGDDESYAYAVGSRTIKRGVVVEGESFIDGYISPYRFCVGDSLEFDAQIGTDEITRVDWNFGDVTKIDSDPQIKHAYTSPGWKDITADLYGRQMCTENTPRHLGIVQFSLYVGRPDTIRHQAFECLEENEVVPVDKPDTVKWDCDSVVITTHEFGHKTSYTFDKVVDNGIEINGTWYETSQEVRWTVGKNKQGCDSINICNLRVLTCLKMDIPNNAAEQHICQGDAYYDLHYDYTKGDIGEMHFIIDDKDITVKPNKEESYIRLQTADLVPGIYKATITVEDTICRDETTNKPRVLSYPIDFTVYYPSNIFKYKFNNVLAVYNKDNNGGYDFVEYQWYYKEDGKTEFVAIPGATSSIYHTQEPIEKGEYFVMLTRADGVVLPSCSQTIDYWPEMPQSQNAPAATKHLVNRQIVIRHGQQSYNIYGQRVQ